VPARLRPIASFPGQSYSKRGWLVRKAKRNRALVASSANPGGNAIRSSGRFGGSPNSQSGERYAVHRGAYLHNRPPLRAFARLHLGVRSEGSRLPSPVGSSHCRVATLAVRHAHARGWSARMGALTCFAKSRHHRSNPAHVLKEIRAVH
jgi:hypothetical protein